MHADTGAVVGWAGAISTAVQCGFPCSNTHHVINQSDEFVFDANVGLLIKRSLAEASGTHKRTHLSVVAPVHYWPAMFSEEEASR